MSQELRPYQQKALDGIRDHFRKGKKRVLLHLATGGGKTLIFCKVLKGVYEKGSRAIMVVRGKDLVDQASQRLFKEGVEHGVLQGNHWNYRPNCNIQICSIDTLHRRRDKIALPEADLVVIDEAHFAISKSFRWLADQYKEAFFLPVTATPHVKEGLRHVASEVVYPITIKELIKEGYLVEPVYYAPSKPDLNGIKVDKMTGDYKVNDLATAMHKAALYGDIINHWKKLAVGRPTVCFAVDLKHAAHLVESFTKAEVIAEMVEADTPKAEREAVQERLKTGQTHVVVNVGILCVGVDLPYVSALILARPTKSYNLFIQQCGRGTRTYEGKKDFIVLDHANNIREHGFIEDERICNLDGKPPSVGDGEPTPITCKECFCTFCPVENGIDNPTEANAAGRCYICPGCGYDNSPPVGPRKKDLDNKAELVKLDAQAARELKRQEIDNFTLDKCEVAISAHRKPGWVFFQVKEKYGHFEATIRYDSIKRIVPEQDRESRPPRQ